MTKTFRAVLAGAALLASGCGTVGGEYRLEGNESALCSQGLLGQAIKSTGKVPEGCVKIEGEEIGQAPQTLELDGVSVTITDWLAKGDSPGDYVGFTFEADGAIAYAVKASTRTFAGTSTTWVHPDGTSGPKANGISNITFCPDEEGDPGENPGTGTPDAGTPDDFPGEVPGDGGGECGGGSGTPDGGDFNENPGSGDVDAGSPNLPPQSPGSTCSVDSECLSEICAEGVCQDSPGGGACNVASDCADHYLCIEGACVPEIG